MSDDKTTATNNQTDNQTNSQDNSAASDQSAKVTVYSTSWCAFCHTEMEWLKKLGIDFVAKDIEADPSAKEELLSKNGGNFQGVPVTDSAARSSSASTGRSFRMRSGKTV